MQVLLLFSYLDTIQRWLSDIDMSSADQLSHLPVEKSEQEGSDVAPVHVSVGHDDDLVVTQPRRIELFRPNPSPQRGNYCGDLVVTEHFVETSLLDVQNLPFDGQDRLEAPISTLLRGSACRVTLNNKELGKGGILLLTVGQLAR